MKKSLGEKKYGEALRSAQRVLEKNFADIDAPFAARIACRELEDRKKFEFHSFVSRGLISSILDSGSGQSKEEGFMVIRTREEYIILEILGLTARGKQTVQHSGQTFDPFQVVDRKSGAGGDVFFNVSIPFDWLSKKDRK